MNFSFTRILLALLFTIPMILATHTLSHGEVVVFDGVTTVQTPIRIKVLTKGRFFAKGGRLVDLYLDDKHLKQILTGGDGYGFFKIIPADSGVKEIRARSDAKTASGRILVMTKSEKAIVIDVEGAFRDTIFSEELREDSQKVVSALGKNYRIIYMSSFVGKGISHKWLKMEDFPESVILRWQGKNTFKSLEKRGVSMYAVIGSAAVISAARKYIENRYTFERSKDGKMVKNWDEILKLLQAATPAKTPDKNPP